MNEKTPAERVKELLNEIIELYLETEGIPDSPISTMTNGKDRRILRRAADRLRNGEPQRTDKNMWSKPQLIRLYENTVKRDEILERTHGRFGTAWQEIGRLVHEDPPGTEKAFDEFFTDLELQAKLDGPGSRAEARFRQREKFERFIIALNTEMTTSKRRQKRPEKKPEKKPGRLQVFDPSGRIPIISAEIVDTPLPGETVVRFPADGKHSGPDQIFLRFDTGSESWVGDFECGLHYLSSAFPLPDRKHLFVSACGAGYMIDIKTRALVYRTGIDISGTHRNIPMTIFLAIHNGESLEAFGANGRLWKTKPIGSGIRNIGYNTEAVYGEAFQKPERQWMRFAVNKVTGEVTRSLYLP
ncbi:MAG TPA: hypothetical protein VGR95_05360 [Thermoanaerobaculia bacterium]|jgi:hypothetical protein|nr:hypothetical protein [Thermoanaerobaculia bacterium]